jgi:hypothetical protein
MRRTAGSLARSSLNSVAAGLCARLFPVADGEVYERRAYDRYDHVDAQDEELVLP